MWVHRRLAALALFGIQLLQGTLPAAGGACADTASTTGRDAVATAPHAHHGHHAVVSVGTAPVTAAVAAPAPVPTDAPAPPPAHPHESTTCPMAMACTIAGLMSTAVAVELHDVLVTTDRSERVTDHLVSVDVTPEPPPPRR